jgi:hypothetical protein
VGYTTFNQTAGSGRKYRKNKYNKYTLYTEDEFQRFGYFEILITHYMGPAEYPPADPNPNGYNNVPKSWDATSPRSIMIDGHPGTVIYAEHEKLTRWIYTCQLNSSTFILIQSPMDWDKDVSLAIETLHITEKSD